MKKPILFAVLTLLLISSYVAAGGCAVRHRAFVVKKEAVVVEKVVAAAIVPVAVYAPVPVYGASYVPPPVPAANDDLKAILDALKALDSRLKSLEKPTPTSPTATPPEKKDPPKPPDPFNPGPKTGAIKADHAPFLALAQAKCASCHDKKVSAEKGGGLTLLDGEALAPLNDKQQRKLAVAAYTGKMPPKSSMVAQLSDEEVASVMTYLDTLK